MNYLEIAANVAEILTAVVAGFAYIHYRLSQSRKRKRLEHYLRSERVSNPKRRTHTILHVMAQVALTQEEVLRASFDSSHIDRLIHAHPDTGLADDILLRYKD